MEDALIDDAWLTVAFGMTRRGSRVGKSGKPDMSMLRVAPDDDDAVAALWPQLFEPF